MKKHESCPGYRKWNKGFLIAATAVLLLSNQLFAQNNASKQPLPTFKYRADNAADTSRQCKVNPNRETKAVSVCAVWNLADTAERTLWSMADSSGKVAAKAGGKTVRAGVPAVRTDIAGLPRKARKKPLTFTMGGDSVRRDALLEGLFYPYALSQTQRVAAESYLALKYGVTLREDYLSPEGDTLWNHSSDSLFSHAVAGLGCDTLHGLQKLEGGSAESDLLRMKLLSSANNNRVSLLPRQYLLWGGSEGKLSFGAGSAFALVGDSIVLFDLMERTWLVRTTGTSGSRTQLSVSADSLPRTDSLYLLVDRSGKGFFDGSECYGPVRADSNGMFVFDVRWDSDNSGTDFFTFACSGTPERLMSTMMNGDNGGEGNPGGSTGIRDARNQGGKTAVWPNPASERLHVRTMMSAPVEAAITNSQGKLLLRQSFTQPSFEINVGSLATGSYTLRLQSGNNVENIPFVVK
ncbi:MAG: T9SS type A sorting domain-containing protein [Bacteroidales bacterium]|nr:T9SS type A sorting domain-containing protein [Bacteroidales bacterium]